MVKAETDARPKWYAHVSYAVTADRVKPPAPAAALGLDRKETARRLLAEFLGTFLLIFACTGAVVLADLGIGSLEVQSETPAGDGSDIIGR